MPDEPTPTAPSWTRSRRAEAAADAADEGAGERPAGAPWLGQTEPFLRALERSLEPVEAGLARIADAARTNHGEMASLGAETHDGLRAVTDALAEAQRAFTASADAVRARADAAAELIGRVGGEVERVTQVLAEAEERAAAARAVEREQLAQELADAEGRLTEQQASAARSLEGAVREAAEASARELAARLETLRGAADRLADHHEAAATDAAAHREATDASATHLTTRLDALGESTARREDVVAVHAAADRAIELLRETETRLAGQLTAAAEVLEQAARESDAELAALVTGATGELDVKLRTAVRDAADDTTARVAAAEESLAARLDGLGATAGTLSTRDEAAAAQARVEAHLDATRDQLAERQEQSADRLAQRVATSVAELDRGLKRIERLGDLIEAMATKRGFQELVSSEAALREEQGAFVANLGDASTRVEEQVAIVTGHADDLARRLEAAARDAASLREVPPQTAEHVGATMAEANDRLSSALRSAFAEDVSRTTAELRKELEAGVPVAEVLASLERLAATQAEVAAAHGDATAAAGTVAGAADELRTRMEGWGEARSAPHLAEELAALDERVRRIEQYVADDLAAALSELVSKQVVDALDERERERPKGIFRRT